MTAFNKDTDLPSNIDSLEKLAFWVGSALAQINLTTTAIEAPGYTQRVAQHGVFYVEADNKYRALIRMSIPMNVEHLIGANNPWTYAMPISETAIPASFKTAA
ncbi:hypothetical protein [Calothrix sp. 336/3]|nr:hypothetical protein [Calothrix sp. 336/3]AKG21277.1 glucose-6-phosphate dehydrogenase [Calothrix sp. 336/3]AKG21789.1 glucose-6-phosphate dehydrogenase [Calothrix sp. 336/3]